jgi:hypothetical protein
MATRALIERIIGLSAEARKEKKEDRNRKQGKKRKCTTKRDY